MLIQTPTPTITLTTVMPKSANYILQIKLANIEDFSPAAVVQSPRTFRPGDVTNACANVLVEGDAPIIVSSLAHFLAAEFFALAHGSGLYNRQKKLWESLAKTQTIQAVFDTKGLFSKTQMPSFQLSATDSKGRLISLLRYEAAAPGAPVNAVAGLKNFLKTVSQKPTGAVGLFFACAAPFPQAALEYTRRETNSTEGLARYESILPKLGIPLNLVEVDTAHAVYSRASQERLPVRLVHPDLGPNAAKRPSGSRAFESSDSEREQRLNNVESSDSEREQRLVENPINDMDMGPQVDPASDS